MRQNYAKFPARGFVSVVFFALIHQLQLMVWLGGLGAFRWFGILIRIPLRIPSSLSCSGILFRNPNHQTPQQKPISWILNHLIGWLEFGCQPKNRGCLPPKSSHSYRDKPWMDYYNPYITGWYIIPFLSHDSATRFLPLPIRSNWQVARRISSRPSEKLCEKWGGFLIQFINNILSTFSYQQTLSTNFINKIVSTKLYQQNLSTKFINKFYQHFFIQFLWVFLPFNKNWFILSRLKGRKINKKVTSLPVPPKPS